MTEQAPQKEPASIGRPTLYHSGLADKVDDYLRSCVDEQDGSHFKVNLPKIEGLARYLGVNKDTLYEWAKRYPEFSDALERVKNEQYSRLVDQGLAGRYNSTIAKLILSANHGLAEASKSVTLLSPPFQLGPEEKARMNSLLDDCLSGCSKCRSE